MDAFPYPLAGAAEAEDAALRRLEDRCAENETHLILTGVPADRAAALFSRYPRFHVLRESGGTFRVDVENELYGLEAVPALATERLTLDALTDADRAAYAALCLDDTRNRLWGYDYREDWRGEPPEDYFLDTVRRDFAARVGISFAVRLRGVFIGEAVLYRFDGRGGAEQGCRIAPAFARHGYGIEAFAAVAEWGLRDLGLRHIAAKCFRENRGSYRMLSSCMSLRAEDETYFYFDKEV